MDGVHPPFSCSTRATSARMAVSRPCSAATCPWRLARPIFLGRLSRKPKPWENQGKPWEHPGKPWENPGKPWENQGKTKGIQFVAPIIQPRNHKVISGCLFTVFYWFPCSMPWMLEGSPFVGTLCALFGGCVFI